MKLLISGATGLVGSAVVAHCKAQQIPVHYLSRNAENLSTDPTYRGFYWNPSTAELDSNCFDGVTHIVNLAGAPIAQRWTAANKAEILNSRVDSLQTLNAGLSKYPNHQVQAILSASAVGIYEDSLTHFYEEKESQLGDSFPAEVVKAWEDEADNFAQLGLRVSKLRIGLVLSGEGGALPKIAQPVKHYAGAAFGSGEQWQSWIHIDDLASIIVYILQHDLQGVFNAVAPNPVTQNKLVKELAKVLQKPLILPKVPKFVIRTALGSMADILLSSQRVSSKKIESSGYQFQFVNICKALEDIYAAEATQ